MAILLFLRGGIHQARIRSRILRFEFFDRLKIGRVRDDFGELLDVLELIQLCFAFLRFDNCSAHDFSSALKSTPQSKIDNRKLTPVATVSLSRRRRAKADDRRSRASASIQGTFHTNPRFVQHMRINHPRKQRSRDLVRDFAHAAYEESVLSSSNEQVEARENADLRRF